MVYDMSVVDGLLLSNWDDTLIEKLKKGNISCVHACCGLWENARETLSNIGKWQRFFNEHHESLMQVTSGYDLYKAKKEGKIGVILGTQNTSPLEDELTLVEVFNNLGIKIMQLTYNNQNLIGSSCYEAFDNGLSRYGKLVVEEMNRVGMIVDLSHVGEKTSMDAIETSSRPVAITHANPNWFYSTKRNKSRELLQKLRDNGGVLGLCIYPHLMNGAETTLDEFCDMAAATMEFMGGSQVALGTDLTFNMSNDFLQWMRMGRWTHQVDYGAGSAENPGWPKWPGWFQDPSDFPAISEALLKRGLSEEDVSNFLGRNWERFFTIGFQQKKEMHKNEGVLSGNA
ncbi:microsomal dipeptidase-like Zn-dependent dipeptidase [Scopulibacillus darangshiensis]|uniref:Microsomal dipeptidase-like Zn-dependent dipeptidase n=1 Tax=Scopulibacillus darangshiensis TaxID=442528 RepID=A0A4R2P297_9BACL|nr:membrane dipeptidase [Scopulibacillus darangshiensis]TCP27815.1 microsomal dipeptidase-like Zn-dependent dipeptidase [Scopulibacillus darangshiensis]